MPFVDGTGTVGAALGAQAEGSLVLRPEAEVASILLLAGTIRRSPRVLSAVASSHKIRVTFDGQMAIDSQLVNPANYTITPLASVAPVTVLSVAPQAGATYPSYVDLSTSEMTLGGSYRATVATGATSPRDRHGFTVNTVGNFADFTGFGVLPTIVSVAAVSSNRADVKFSEPMLDDGGAIRTAAKYQWDGGLATLSVLDVVGDTVQLITSDQVPGQLYTLTIS